MKELLTYIFAAAVLAPALCAQDQTAVALQGKNVEVKARYHVERTEAVNDSNPDRRAPSDPAAYLAPNQSCSLQRLHVFGDGVEAHRVRFGQRRYRQSAAPQAIENRTSR